MGQVAREAYAVAGRCEHFGTERGEGGGGILVEPGAKNPRADGVEKREVLGAGEGERAVGGLG